MTEKVTKTSNEWLNMQTWYYVKMQSPRRCAGKKCYVHLVHGCVLEKISLTNKGPAKSIPHLQKTKSSDSLYSGGSDGGGVGSGLTSSFWHTRHF